MAEILSPGVFVEEIPSQIQVIQSVSTSGVGAVGYTTKGPSDTATLVTSYDQFVKKFGGPVRESYLPLLMAAYFSNGGRRAYVVRVTPADAVSADAKIQSATEFQQIETGDNIVVAFSKTSGTTTLKVNSGASPIVPSTFTVKWRATGTPVAAQDARNRGNTADVALVNGTANYEARVNPAGLQAIDDELDVVVRGTAVVTWQPDAVAPRTLAIGVGTSSVVTSAANGEGSVATFDYRTGFFSVKFAGTDVPGAALVGDLQIAFTPTTATRSVTDDGAGVLPAGSVLTGPGSINYTTGAYSFTTVAAPHASARILASYTINAWDLNPVSKGAWGNDIRVQITGAPNYYTASTATFSRFNVSVLLFNSNSSTFDPVESYEELVFNDTSSSVFFADVINELSDFITVTEPAGNEAPLQLQGKAKTFVVAGGNEIAGNQTIQATLPSFPIEPRSVSIAYTDSAGVARTITDNGSGALIGHVDSTGVNTINYATGVIDFKTLNLIRGSTVVVATYRKSPSEDTHTETFGDTTKSYTVGTNGTFDSTNYGRSQFSAPALSATAQGVFALDRIEENLQVAVPDFAGDVTVTGDLLDYADSRAALPSGGDRFIILTVPAGSSAQEAVDWKRFDLGRFSKFAALYWPWIQVADPLSDNRPLLCPPMLHVAGIYARTDVTRNVGKAPAGTTDGALRFLVGLEIKPTQGERDLVYPNNINPLIDTTATGKVVWGARTMAQESEWRQINARRLFMFLEKSVYNSTQWAVFENNGPNLWTRLKAQLNGFLSALFGEGYFAGRTPAEAFFVVVDETNNDATTIANGQLIVDIGVAPNKPAEFVRMRFTQSASGS